MKPQLLLAESMTPEGDQLSLISHDGHFLLKLNGAQLLTSFAHASEEALAELGCAPVRPATKPHILIGGLGLGYTLTAARRALPQKGARFTVAEPIPELVAWNKTHLAELHPGLWEDPRIQIHRDGVRTLLGDAKEVYSVILLDTDHGPESFTGENNEALYSLEGLATLSAALKAGGILAVWSADEDPAFEKRLRQSNFDVSKVEVPAAHRGKRKRKHVIWIARNGQYQPKKNAHKL